MPAINYARFSDPAYAGSYSRRRSHASVATYIAAKPLATPTPAKQPAVRVGATRHPLASHGNRPLANGGYILVPPPAQGGSPGSKVIDGIVVPGNSQQIETPADKAASTIESRAEQVAAIEWSDMSAADRAKWTDEGNYVRTRRRELIQRHGRSEN